MQFSLHQSLETKQLIQLIILRRNWKNRVNGFKYNRCKNNNNDNIKKKKKKKKQLEPWYAQAYCKSYICTITVKLDQKRWKHEPYFKRFKLQTQSSNVYYEINTGNNEILTITGDIMSKLCEFFEAQNAS